MRALVTWKVFSFLALHGLSAHSATSSGTDFVNTRARAHTYTHTIEQNVWLRSIHCIHKSFARLKKHTKNSNNKTKAQLLKVCIVWSIFLDLWYGASDFCYLLPRNLQWFSRDYHEWASTTVFSVRAPNGYGGLRAIPSPFFAEFD